MTISNEDLLDSLTTLVEPLLKDFQDWVQTVNTELKARRDRSSTPVFPATCPSLISREQVGAEVLVVSIGLERRARALIGRADVSTGEGTILAECEDIELAESDRHVESEGQLRDFVDEVGAMLQSVKARRDIQLTLARE